MANPRPEASLLEGSLSWVSAGDRAHKGLAVAGVTAEVIARGGVTGQWSIAAEMAGGPTLLGIWSQPANPGPRTYRGVVLAALDAHAEAIMAGEVVVAGDFNIGDPLGSDVWEEVVQSSGGGRNSAW